MLSQQDDSFKHISRLCKRHSHCCSVVYTAVNSSFKWKRTVVVILWNNSKNYQSLLNKELLAPFIWLLYFRHRLECFWSLRGSSATWNHRRYWPWKRPEPHVPYYISWTISLVHNATWDPSSDILVRTEWENCAEIPLCRSQPELQANPFNPVQYT